MYVRITGDDSQTLYDCFSMKMKNSEQVGDKVHLILDTVDGEVRVTVNKRERSVYVMNDDGATIDSYQWSPAKELDGSEPSELRSS